MSFEWEQPESLDGGGNYLSEPGKAHFAVVDVSTKEKDGELIEGFAVNFEVLAHDEAGQEKSTVRMTFFNGKLSHKDGGESARKKQAALFVATGILGPADIDSIVSRKPKIELEKMAGRQICMEVEYRKDKDGKLTKYFEPVYYNIYHVDDTLAKRFPKSAAALSLLPKSLRRTPEELQSIKDAFGPANPRDAATSKPSAPVSLGDL